MYKVRVCVCVYVSLDFEAYFHYFFQILVLFIRMFHFQKYRSFANSCECSL